MAANSTPCVLFFTAVFPVCSADPSHLFQKRLEPKPPPPLPAFLGLEGGGGRGGEQAAGPHNLFSRTKSQTVLSEQRLFLFCEHGICNLTAIHPPMIQQNIDDGVFLHAGCEGIYTE